MNDLNGAINNREFELIHPESGPDVLAKTTTWYGLYYDENHEIQSIVIQYQDNFGTHYANDQRANDIVDWIRNN